MKKIKNLKPNVEVSLNVTDLIQFIEKNSDMSWNEVCDFTSKYGLSFEMDNREYIQKGDSRPKPLQDFIDAFIELHSKELNGEEGITLIFND